MSEQVGPNDPYRPPDAVLIRLYSLADPHVWAEEFCRMLRMKRADDSAVTSEWVEGWFTNFLAVAQANIMSDIATQKRMSDLTKGVTHG